MTAIDWSQVKSRFQAGDLLSPLVGSSTLVVDSIDDEQLCIRQRLWRACLTRTDLQTANDVLAQAGSDVTPVEFAELMRARVTSGTSGTGTVTECTRIPNLAAVVLLNLGVLRADSPPS